MERYPALSMYRTIAKVLIVIVIIAGIINLFGARFSIITLLASLLSTAILVFGLMVGIESINLLLSVDERLDTILTRLENRTTAISSAAGQSTQSRPSVPLSLPEEPVQQVYEATVRAKIKTQTPLRTKPELDAPSTSTLFPGQNMTIYGRTEDSRWLTLSRMGKFWINADDLEVTEGTISSLPIIEPGQ